MSRISGQWGWEAVLMARRRKQAQRSASDDNNRTAGFEDHRRGGSRRGYDGWDEDRGRDDLSLSASDGSTGRKVYYDEWT